MKYLLIYLAVSIPATWWICRCLRYMSIRDEIRNRMIRELMDNDEATCLCNWAERRANPADLIHEDYDAEAGCDSWKDWEGVA